MSRLASLCIAVLVSGSALADFPKAAVRAVVTFPPGGPADVMARLIYPAFEKNLGGTVWIDNRAGDGGALGFTAVAKAAPDGHTILLTTSAPLTLGTAMRRLPFSLDDFEYLGAFGGDSTAILSRPGREWTDIDDLFRYAKSKPDKISYASPGSATAPFLTMEAVLAERGLVMTAVHYRGTNPVVTSVLGGHTEIGVGGFAAVKQMVRSKKLVVLAITGQRRDPEFPDIPTLEEKGLSAANIDLWAGGWAPKGTPKEVLAKLAGALEKAATDPEVVARFGSTGYRGFWLPGDKMREMAMRDHERAAKVVKALNGAKK